MDLEVFLTATISENLASSLFTFTPLSKFSIYKKLGSTRKNFINSTRLYNEIISLPLYPDIKKQEQDIVIKTISSIQKNT